MLHCDFAVKYITVDKIPANDWELIRLWLRQYADGKVSRGAPAFTAEEVNKFMTEAPDDIFIKHKLAMGVGLQGRLRAMDYTWLYYKKNDKEKILLLKG